MVIVSVGKIRERYLREGVNDFLTRLRPYASMDWIDSLEGKILPHPSALQINSILEKEGHKILSKLRDKDFLVALDARGKSMTSEDLALTIQDLLGQRLPRIVFVVGGSHGLSPEVLKRANLILSLSQLTFPHQMAVLILLEQLYRSFKIIKGEPYHK